MQLKMKHILFINKPTCVGNIYISMVLNKKKFFKLFFLVEYENCLGVQNVYVGLDVSKSFTK